MNVQPKTRLASSGLAVVLWIFSALLGLQSIYYIKELFYLIYVSLGGGIAQAEQFVPGLVFILAVVYLIFIIGATEYHIKRVGRPESWRLFGWTIAVEVSLLILYYLL
ncbi:MAG: hypothetical protein L0287_12045 [Anaerolineae bacterium]|nr:hypothetical protein [Anaerolineae bacterium]